MFTALKTMLFNAKKPGYPWWMSNEIKANEGCFILVAAIAECWDIKFRHGKCVSFGES